MPYIIVWRNSHVSPHVDIDDNHILQTYATEELAREEAERVYKIQNETNPSPWYFDYKIYKEVQ